LILVGISHRCRFGVDKITLNLIVLCGRFFLIVYVVCFR